MVKIVRAFRDLDMDDLAAVYGLDSAAKFEEYKELQDYLREDFFNVPGAFYALLEAEGTCVSVLRAEPYRDGFIIEALETRTDARSKGYATKLLQTVVLRSEIPADIPVYAHIHKKNVASLRVHRACGFKDFLDYAVYIDGSVYHHSCTMILRR